ncbi:response regulator transcription factor [Streptomyces cavernae]|uniref:response regulator transcription factor n=1 Tax=Streptomyces cavernae TaxID=2259034 RepID=UPI0030B84EFA
MLSVTLELGGYQVGSTDTGGEALARLAEHPFDLVVLDVTLPDLDHLAQGRRLPGTGRPPVLFLTGYESLGRLGPEVGLGDQDYVTKPFRIAEVLARHRCCCAAGGTARGPAPSATVTWSWTTSPARLGAAPGTSP